MRLATLLYLVDTSVLIDAKNHYYPIDRIPHFWNRLLLQARVGNIKLPAQVIGEILGPDIPDEMPADELADWVESNMTDLMLSEELDDDALSRTIERGYSTSLARITASDPLSEAADPFLIAYALASPEGRQVVTMERIQSKGNSLPKPANRRIPLVCDLLGVKCINTFELIRELDFRIPLSPNIGDIITTS